MRHYPTASDKLSLFFSRSEREDARRKGQMNPSYRPSHRTQAVVWVERGSWKVELTEAGGRKATGSASSLERAIEIAERGLYGW